MKNDERKIYKDILEAEKMMIIHHMEEITDEFDGNVFKLFQIKMKYNSAINQEYLKIIRLSKLLSDDSQRMQQVKQYE